METMTLALENNNDNDDIIGFYQGGGCRCRFLVLERICEWENMKDRRV